MAVNDHLILLCGKSTTGKSTALKDLVKPEGVLYLNTENGKRLPFKTAFIQKTITDPLQVYEAFDWAETKPEIHTIIIDSLTFLCDMYDTMYIHGSANGQAAWGNFNQYIKALMQQYVASSTKKIIFTAHTEDVLNKTEMAMETRVPVKGSLKGNGLEAFFSVIVSSKKVPITALEQYKSNMLTITPKEKDLGFKYVFQTCITKDTVNERIRGPIGMFSTEETYTDNNIQLILDRLSEYYK